MSQKCISIIAKPTHDCNLECKYCYVEKNVERGRMSERLLSQSVERVSDFAECSHWIWHGGEPLLMGLEFFKIVKDIQEFYRKRDREFSNGIQTNGTLITEELLDFIEQTRDFHIGASLDGPAEVHNLTRVYPDGRGSFNDVKSGLDLIKRRKKNLGGGVICVINRQNVTCPEKIYKFFKLERINVKFNPLIRSGRAETNLKKFGISPKQYGNFLSTLWDIYNEDVEKAGRVSIDIDPFMEIIGNLESEKPFGCNYSVSCRDSFISIGPQGDIYPCGRFDGVPAFWMGNIKNSTIEMAINSQINKKLRARKLESVIGCKPCDFGKICNSGCMHNAYLNGNVFGKDPYCISYKMLFSKMRGVIDLEAELKGGFSKDEN